MASIKFGKLALRKYWQNLNLAIWILSAIGAHAIIYIGEFFLIWRPLPNSPNRLIKNLAKVSRYTVVCWVALIYILMKTSELLLLDIILALEF